jgi:hypothetical protein
MDVKEDTIENHKNAAFFTKFGNCFEHLQDKHNLRTLSVKINLFALLALKARFSTCF